MERFIPAGLFLVAIPAWYFYFFKFNTFSNRHQLLRKRDLMFVGSLAMLVGAIGPYFSVDWTGTGFAQCPVRSCREIYDVRQQPIAYWISVAVTSLGLPMVFFLGLRMFSIGKRS